MHWDRSTSEHVNIFPGTKSMQLPAKLRLNANEAWHAVNMHSPKYG